MYCLRVLAFCCCLTLVSSSLVLAQNPVSSVRPESDEERKKKEALEKKALVMLDELIEQAPAFRLPENRVWVLAFAADLLWTRDEKRARALFNEATNIFASIANQADSNSDLLQSRLPVLYANVMNLRGQILQLLGNHDMELAYSFLTATRPPPGRDGAIYQPDQELHFEMMLIQRLAAKNPQQALMRAEDMLASGKPLYAVQGILEGLRAHDPDAAQKLAGLLVSRLLAEDPPRIDSAHLSLQLLSMGAQSSQDDKNQKSKPLLSSAQARSLIEKLVAQGAANPRHSSGHLLSQLKSLTPYIEKHSPASLPLIKKMRSESDPSQRQWEVMHELLQKGSVDELLTAAAQAPQEMRQHYYQNAAMQAAAKGDDERAQRIIKENISDSGQRQVILQALERDRVHRRKNEGQIDAALELVHSIKLIPERINLLVEIAAKAGNAGRRDLALKLLDDAWKLVGGPLESSTQFHMQMQVSNAWIPIAPARSFEIIESTIDKFNELFAAAAIMWSFEPGGNFREREMVFFQGRSNWIYMQVYSPQLAALAAVDPERLESLLKRLAFPDQRAVLQLEMAGTILRGNSIPSNMTLSSNRNRLRSF